jgi:hypothetical protein
LVCTVCWTQGDHDGGGKINIVNSWPSTEKTHPRKLYMESYQTEGPNSHSVAKSSSCPNRKSPNGVDGFGRYRPTCPHLAEGQNRRMCVIALAKIALLQKPGLPSYYWFHVLQRISSTCALVRVVVLDGHNRP